MISNHNIQMRNPSQISFVGISIIFLIALAWWTFSKPKVNVTISEPGMDNREDKAGGLNEIINIGEFFESFLSSTTTFEESWPRFRGSDFDNIKKGGVDLIDQFELSLYYLLLDLKNSDS